MKFGLRVRVTLWSVAANGLVLAAGTAVLFWLLDQQLTGALDEALVAQARTTAAAVETWVIGELRSSPGRSDPRAVGQILGAAQTSLQSLFTLPKDVPASLSTMTTLLSTDGQIILSTHNFNSDHPDSQALREALGGSVNVTQATANDVSGQGRAFRVATAPVGRGPHAVALVQVWGPLQSVRWTLARVQNLLVSSMLALLILNAWLMGMALRRAFRPVDALVADIHRITERNLSVRVPVPDTKDEIRSLAETFNAMLDRLDQGFQFQTRLFQDLSHQLKTPLAILTGTLETALIKGRTAGEYRDILESNLDDVARMTQLIETLLLLARLDSKQVILQLTPWDLEEFCRRWVEDFSLLLESKDLKAVWVSAGRIPVVIDPARIGQAILNLVENAVKYSPPAAAITFEFYRQGAYGGLRLINQGPPLTPGSEEKIFQRFFREAEGSPGFGLGLSIARAAVELHGGTLRTFSPPVGGAGFQLELPLHWEVSPYRDPDRR